MDNIDIEVIAFVVGLHDCHICKYTDQQINGRGKRRIFCTKYGLPIQRVRQHCVDISNGFTYLELREIQRHHKDGKCELMISGVVV